MKLDSDFWGTLLRNLSKGRLWPMHIEGWVTRLMQMRQVLLRRNGSSSVCWTILPPQFRDSVCHQETKHSAKYADGTHELFPPFWEVDYVYIPLYIKGTEDWLLVRIDLRTMELLQYWSNNMYQADYGGLIFLPTLDMFQWGFGWLLDEINFWRKYNGPYVPESRRHRLTFAGNDDYLPKDGGDLEGDSGVLVCMLMHKLTRN